MPQKETLRGCVIALSVPLQTIFQSVFLHLMQGGAIIFECRNMHFHVELHSYALYSALCSHFPHAILSYH